MNEDPGQQHHPEEVLLEASWPRVQMERRIWSFSSDRPWSVSMSFFPSTFDPGISDGWLLVDCGSILVVFQASARRITCKPLICSNSPV